MLTDSSLEQILAAIPRLRVGVLGDLFLDRYLELDAALTEPSLETGLDAYQVTRVCSYPGAAGTVINNLVALGVQRVLAVAVIGDDGEGYELTRALEDLRAVDTHRVHLWESRRTPTYTKPMLHSTGQTPRELNRLDIKNRAPLPAAAEDLVLKSLEEIWPQVDALLVVDQVSEENCGAVSARVRQRLSELGAANPAKLILADSRERIGLFHAVWTKPNEKECARAAKGHVAAEATVEECANELARRTGRPVFCTCGAEGIFAVDPRSQPPVAMTVPAFRVAGPTDPVGAGDSASAALACALASGASLTQAAAFGNLVASITIQQLGTTGTATPAQVRQRWREVT